MSTLLLTIAATITMQMSEVERNAAMAKYFNPPPGSMVELDEREIREKGMKKPFRINGFIEVTPPKGKCFIVTRRDDVPDTRVCKATTLTWNAKDIRAGGFIEWQVQVVGDQGPYPYRWPTPHRVGRTISSLNPPPTLSNPELILSCEVKLDERGRRITLRRPNRTEWIILFPKKDRLVSPQPPKEPNLFIQTKKGLQGISEESSTDLDSKYEHEPERAKANALKKESVTTYWTLPTRDSYTMNSSNFLSRDAAPKMNGSCRYRLKQQMDKEVGFIECHDTSDYAVVYIPLPCLPELLETH